MTRKRRFLFCNGCGKPVYDNRGLITFKNLGYVRRKQDTTSYYVNGVRCPCGNHMFFAIDYSVEYMWDEFGEV
jgi:hypothetical protein